LALLGTLNLPERLRERRRQSGERASANDGANAGAAGESRSNLLLMDTYIERSYEMRYFLEAAAAEKGGEKGGEGNGASSANDGSEGGGGAYEDKYAYLHPNGLCVLGVAPTHRAVGLALAQWQADGRRSQSGDGAGGGVSGTPKVSVEFNRKWEVSDFQFKSKKRKDAVSLHKDTLMCTIKVNGTAFAVRSGVKGHLLELNKRLLDDPTLWFRKPATEGWLAVIQLLHAKQTKEVRLLSHPPIDPPPSQHTHTMISSTSFASLARQ